MTMRISPAAFAPAAGPRSLRLTAEQERELAVAIAAGDRDARERMVRANMGLVVVIARRYLGRGTGLGDQVVEGTLGLIRAADDFDPDFGVRFGTYAAHWIRQAIGQALTDTAELIRLPAYMTQILRRWRRAERDLRSESGSAPSSGEVADRLGLGESQRLMVRQALRARRLRAGDAESGFDSMAAAGEGPGEALSHRERLGSLRSRMARRLGERERAVLTLRFGLDGGEPMSLKRVGERLGMTKECVRTLEARAVARLRSGAGPDA